MINIRTQSELNAIVASTPTNERIVIHPNDDGTPYTLLNSWVLNSNIIITGVNLPEIQYTGTYSGTSEYGFFYIAGASTSTKQNILIRGLKITSSKVSSNFSAIFGNYLGSSKVTTQKKYDSTVVGSSMTNTSGIVIEDCVITGFNSGIVLRNSFNCTVRGNKVFNNSLHAIVANPLTSSIISNNQVYNNGGRGILVSGSSIGNIVTGNSVLNNSDYGIGVIETTLSVINGNAMTNNSTGMYTYSASRNSITGNTILNNNTNAINSGSADNLINGNTINNNNRGLYFFMCDLGVMVGNSIRNNKLGAIDGTASNYNTMVGNAIQGNGSGIILNASSNNNLVSSNIFTGNTTSNISNNGTNNNIREENNQIG